MVSEVHHGSHQLSFLRSIIVDRLAGSLADPRYRPHVTFYRNSELSLETRTKIENAGRNQFQGAWDMVSLELRVKKSVLSSPMYRYMNVGRYLRLSDPAFNWHVIPGKPGGSRESKKMVSKEMILKTCELFDPEKSGRVDLYHLGEILRSLGLKASERVCTSLGQPEDEGRSFADYGDVRQKVLMAIMHPNVSLVGIEGIAIDEEPPVVEVD